MDLEDSSLFTEQEVCSETDREGTRFNSRNDNTTITSPFKNKQLTMYPAIPFPPTCKELPSPSVIPIKTGYILLITESPES